MQREAEQRIQQARAEAEERVRDTRRGDEPRRRGAPARRGRAPGAEARSAARGACSRPRASCKTPRRGGGACARAQRDRAAPGGEPAQDREALERAATRLEEIEARAAEAEERAAARREAGRDQGPGDGADRAPAGDARPDRRGRAPRELGRGTRPRRRSTSVAQPLPEIDTEGSSPLAAPAEEPPSRSRSPEPRARAGAEPEAEPEPEPPGAGVRAEAGAAEPEPEPQPARARELEPRAGRGRRRRKPSPQWRAPASTTPRRRPVAINTATYEELRTLGLSVTQTGRVLAHRERDRRLHLARRARRDPRLPAAFLDELKRRLRALASRARTPRAASARPRCGSGTPARRAQSRSSGTSATTAIVAAWSDSAISGPTKVAPTITLALGRRRRSARCRARCGRGSWRRRWPRSRRRPRCASIPSSSAAAERPADRGDLRVGEHHPRRAGLVRGRRDVLAEDRVGADPRLVLAHVGEQRAAVDVADRVQPLRAADAQPVVDLEVAARLDPGGLEPELGRPRPAPDRDQELVAAQLLAALEPQRHLTALAARGGDRLDAGADLDPGRARARRRSARSRTAPRWRASGRRPRPRSTLEPRLLHAWAISTPTTPPPRTSSRSGHLLRPSSPRGSSTAAASASPSIGGTAAAVPVATTTASPAPQRVGADDHRALAVERAAAAKELDPALLQPRQLARVVAVVDHLVAPAKHDRGVELARDHLAHARHPLDLGQQLAGAQQRLRGHAGVVGALAADQLLLDHRHLAARRRRRARRRPRPPARRRSRSRRTPARSSAPSDSPASITHGRPVKWRGEARQARALPDKRDFDRTPEPAGEGDAAGGRRPVRDPGAPRAGACTGTSASSATGCWSPGRCRAACPPTPTRTGSPSTPRTTRSTTSTSRARSRRASTAAARDDLGPRHLRGREVGGREGRRPASTASGSAGATRSFAPAATTG